MSKRRGRRYSEAERAELLELYRQSGYSVSRFCREMEVGYMTMRRWLEDEPPDCALVEVAVAATPADRPVRLSARLPNGIVCELGVELSPEEALNWVRELKSC